MLTIKTPKRSQWHRSGVFIVNFEQVNTRWDKKRILTKNGITLAATKL